MNPTIRTATQTLYVISDLFEDMKVQSEKKQGDQTIADKVIIQLLNTDEQISPKEQVVKKSEKTGLFNALDLGAVWLERALKKNA